MHQEIEEVFDKARTQLIENFDRDVVNKLRIRKAADEHALSQFHQLLWQLTINILDNNIDQIDNNCYSFTLSNSPADSEQQFSTGPYRMGKDVYDAYTYRVGHPLAQYVLSKAKNQDTSEKACIVFNYTDSPEKMFVIENEVGKKGILSAKVIHYHSQKDEEDCIIAVAMDDEGQIMPDDFVEKLMSISGRITNTQFPEIDDSRLKAEMIINRILSVST